MAFCANTIDTTSRTMINAPFKGSQLTLPHLWNEKWRRWLGRQWYSEITIGEYDSDQTTYIEGDIIIWRRRCWCAIWYELVEHLYCIGYLAGSNFQGSPSILIFEHGVSDDYDTQTFQFSSTWWLTCNLKLGFPRKLSFLLLVDGCRTRSVYIYLFCVVDDSNTVSHK